MANARSRPRSAHTSAGSAGSAAHRYRAVLLTRNALPFFTSAALARLGVAMTGLGLVFSVQHGAGSFAVAGVVTGAFAVAEAAAGPQIARAVDRWGQTVVVPGMVLVHVGAIAATVATAGRAPLWCTVVAAVAAGAAIPQPGALSAARWSALLSGPSALRTAFSLEATVNDVVFLTGPIVVTFLSTALIPWAGSAVAATLLLGGCGALAMHRRSAPPTRPPRQRAERPARRSMHGQTFLAVLGVNLGLGCFFGAVPLLVTAAATTEGLRPFTGLVLAVSSAASFVAGLAYGSLRAPPRPQIVQLIATVVLTIAVLAAVAWPTVIGLAVMLLVGGSVIAPLLASSSQLVQATVATSDRTQGFTWINSASAAGIAAGAALVGAALEHGGDHGDVRSAAAMLVALTLVAVASALLGMRRSRTPPPLRR